MARPEHISNEDIARWDTLIDNDTNIPSAIAKNAVVREVCYAGQWLSEELTKLKCKEEFIVRITYTMGQLSFGRDAWVVAQSMLDAFKANELEYEVELSELN